MLNAIEASCALNDDKQDKQVEESYIPFFGSVVPRLCFIILNMIFELDVSLDELLEHDF